MSSRAVKQDARRDTTERIRNTNDVFSKKTGPDAAVD